MKLRHLCRALVGLSALLFLLGVDGAGGQTADDHGDTIGAATPLPLGSSVEGRLDTGEDLDVFRLDLTTESSDTDVWIYADGGLDTVGELLASDGSVIVSNDDGFISGRYRAFHIRWTLSPRVYYIRVSSYSGGTGDRPTGDYGLHAQAVTQYPGGGDIATATPLGCAWSAVDGDNLEYPIAGLDGDAQYEVQVRAINKAGAGRWSRGFTAAAAPSPCSAAGAVANPSDSPGLASDCRTLLEARESLDQEGTLDWEAGTPISAWEGVRVEGTPMRVVDLSLRGCVRSLGDVLEWRYETQTIPQRPDRRTVGCSGLPTPISQDRGKATYCRPTGGRQRHCVRSAQRLHVASPAT